MVSTTRLTKVIVCPDETHDSQAVHAIELGMMQGRCVCAFDTDTLTKNNRPGITRDGFISLSSVG